MQTAPRILLVCKSAALTCHRTLPFPFFSLLNLAHEVLPRCTPASIAHTATPHHHTPGHDQSGRVLLPHVLPSLAMNMHVTGLDSTSRAVPILLSLRLRLFNVGCAIQMRYTDVRTNTAPPHVPPTDVQMCCPEDFVHAR
jgi:hypothetical protein